MSRGITVNGATEQVFGHLKDGVLPRRKAWLTLGLSKTDLDAYVVLEHTKASGVKLKD